MRESALEDDATLPTIARPAWTDHFRLFMSPANMFVVPADWAGLAEVDAFVEGFRAGTEFAAR